MTEDEIKALVAAGVTEALVQRDAALEQRNTAETEEARAAANAQVNFAQRIAGAARSAEEQGFKPLERVGMQLCAFAKAEGNQERALRIIQDEYKAPTVSREIQRTLDMNNQSSVGFLFPGQHIDELVPLLRPATTVMQMGARMYPLVEGKAFIPYQKTGSSCFWFTPGQDIGDTDMTVGQLELVARYLGCIMWLSRFMLNSPKGTNVFQNAGADMVKSLGQEINRAAYLGTGPGQPVGIFKDPIFTSLNKLTVNSLPTIASIVSFVTSFMEQNPPLTAIKWLFGPRFWGALHSACDSTGKPLFREEMAAGKLYGYNFQVDNQLVPGVDNHKKAQVALADWDELYIAEFASVFVEMDISNKWKSHQAGLKVVAATDVGPRQPKAFTVTDSFYTV